ncbi:hypothetical protein PGTUg99_036302 [Puccinia graminis f. sp. tritici]|uniref:Uncharacterized protein n=1 Tax=Puccinia graminis f. sp. tritici TaxID=56615 RepID=A0A5B0RB70_PUCGR|nr:hypothetical protein PGTUg99_036302 [Puccinia graminis f. sp. tritici]
MVSRIPTHTRRFIPRPRLTNDDFSSNRLNEQKRSELPVNTERLVQDLADSRLHDYDLPTTG